MKIKWDDACVAAWQMSSQKVWPCDHLKETKREAHGKSKGTAREKWEGVNRGKKKNLLWIKYINQTLWKKQYSPHVLAANRLLAKNFQEVCFLRDRKKVWVAKPSTSWKLVNTVREKREKGKGSIFLKFCFYFIVFPARRVISPLNMTRTHTFAFSKRERKLVHKGI